MPTLSVCKCSGTCSRLPHISSMKSITAGHTNSSKTRQVSDYTGCLPKLSDQDYQTLKDDIAVRGCLVPIELDEDGRVLDGVHRQRVCSELRIKPPTITRRGFSEDEKRAHALTLNLTRRHLRREDRGNLHRELRRLGKSLRDIAEASGVSEATVRRDVAGAANDAPAVVIGRDGKSYPAKRPGPVLDMPNAITKVEYERDLRVANRPKPAPVAPPVGQYSLIYADPPWRYENSGGRLAIENHYPTMELAEICAFPVPAADDAVLFLWVPNCLVLKGGQVMEAWGFEYKTNAVWFKDRPCWGHYFQNYHEMLLIGTKGKIGTPGRSSREPSVIQAERRAHSQKPDEVYEIIEAMYPQTRKIELFARNARSGWDCWGNQAPTP